MPLTVWHLPGNEWHFLQRRLICLRWGCVAFLSNCSHLQWTVAVNYNGGLGEYEYNSK